jgi:hypothetical protein
MRTHLPAALLATALASSLFAAPAQAAGAPRTFLSAAGSDGNNCTNVATPCRHMAAAYAATAANGEIYVLDPANYGSLTITGPVSIEGHGWASIAPVANNPAITINANPGDKINIIGVVLDGTGLSITTGIDFKSGGRLIVQDSVIRNFTSDGIHFQPNSAGQLFVSNTLVSDNGSIGINIISGSGAVGGALSHVSMEGNGGHGLAVDSTGTAVNVTVSDSVASGNGGNGIIAHVFPSGTSNVMVRNSTITNNDTGLNANGGVIWITRSTITGNGTGWSNSNGGAVLTFGDNDILGNTTVNSAPPSISHE